MSVKPQAQSEQELSPRQIAAAILAGGRSKRMGGGMKALLDLEGKSLARHVADRLAPQATRVVLSVESVSPELEVLGLEQVPDPRPGSNGPLGGLSAALRHASESGFDWLLLAPCDAPFLPTDLGRRLSRAAVAGGSGVAVARYGYRLQPAFSLWNKSLLPELEKATGEKRQAGFFEFLRARRVEIMEWLPAAVDPFFNINDRAALEKARRIITESGGTES